MSQVGKIAFGIPFGQKEADPAKAVDAALELIVKNSDFLKVLGFEYTVEKK